jgi:DNA-binding MarR family transcriptional regulator
VADDRAELDAREAWAMMASLFIGDQHQARLVRVATELGITPVSLKSLFHLRPDTAVPMRDLAEDWHCDASNVTQIVDSLERQGYVERRASPSDRRVKLVALTSEGEAAREKAGGVLHEPPQAIAALGPRDKATLARILRTAMSRADPPITSRWGD